MGTLTFRIAQGLAGRLTSAQMRSWLADFLRQPHPLPADPGSGEGRISLTLPDESVRAAAGFLRCSSSAALRRIAAERLGISSGVDQNTVLARPQEATSDVIPTWPPLLYSRFTTGMPHTNPSQPRKPGITGIEMLFSAIPGMVFLGCVLFAVTRGAKAE